MKYHILYNKVRAIAAGSLMLLAASACQSDWQNGIPTPVETIQQEIAFSATVKGSETAMRSDGSIVNRKETSLLGTETTNFYVGLFGCYTGQNQWSNTASANFMFNQQMKIEAPAAGKNNLTYEGEILQRFWPNNLVGESTTQNEYVSFWAYYPWNKTDDPGQYGIHITNDANGVSDGSGMGKVRFTMHPDASQQSDFMVSDLAADCSKNKYPLQSDGVTPTPVRLTFHHMLAQVRLYAFMRGTDKLVYKEGEYYTTGDTYTDAWGKGHTVTEEEAGKIPVIDETNSVRWQRTDITSPSGNKLRADATLSMSFNNIHTSAVFTPSYNSSTGETTFSYEDVGSLGSATVNHYIQNPYWFSFDKDDPDKRVMLNEEYMYDYFEDTKAYEAYNTSTNPLGGDKLKYLISDDVKTELLDFNGSEKHYNFAPGNIILAIPQVMSDNDVPNITITATGKRRVWNSTDNKWEDGETITAKVTINMLQMKLKWESGFIYCYAFVDELMPGDDKVRGPESITTLFDPTKWSDQW